MRALLLTIAAMVVIGVALPVAVGALLWYLPVPRTWWYLAIMIVNFVIPPAIGVVVMRRVRRLKREIEVERLSRPVVDQQV